MTLIDMIELLGSSIDAGLIPAGEAAHRLVEFSEGGLTLLGAQGSLERHRTIRAEYRRAFDGARSMLAAVTAVRDASTAEEESRARLALDVEVTLQRAADRDRAAWRLLNGDREGYR